MTEEEARAIDQGPENEKRVRVTGGDYSYFGWLDCVFQKHRSTQVRVVVEDDNRRLFIHNLGQIDRA